MNEVSDWLFGSDRLIDTVDLVRMLGRLSFNLLFLLIICWPIYYRRHKNRDHVFTMVTLNVITFAMCVLLRKVPVLSFFSGFHADYHRPSDDWEKIDVPGATEVTRIALSLVERIASRAERPAFVEPPVRPRRTASGEGRGYGPYFGAVPDFGDSEKGVRFADVRAGSPADGETT